ncbi:MAG: WbqC family protein [Flavobacteriales bacterium]|nr:WbqC family protein [Flavobacteriales bacterium]
MTPLLAACYFGPVELYRLLAKHEHAIIDVGEHYVRQSYRTRTRIVGPNGPQDLCVQIAHDRAHEEAAAGHLRKMPMHAVGLSYAETWPQQHLHAIRSAYGNAPWFIHYIDEIADVLSARHARLIDLDLATLKLGLQWLGLTPAIDVKHAYVENDQAAYLDLRSALHPKKPLPPDLGADAPYAQVFELRHGFVPACSVIDLVMNLGPEARGWLFHG